MGSRQLRRWLNRPIRDHAELKRRQQAVDVLQRSGAIEPLQAVLKDIGDLERILTRIGLKSARPRDLPMDTPSLARVEWEHIQRVLADCNGNVSEAARALSMHRRSLQRKLAKYPVNR